MRELVVLVPGIRSLLDGRPGYGVIPTGAMLDERWTELLGRKVWRNINTGETWVEEKC